MDRLRIGDVVEIIGSSLFAGEIAQLSSVGYTWCDVSVISRIGWIFDNVNMRNIRKVPRIGKHKIGRFYV